MRNSHFAIIILAVLAFSCSKENETVITDFGYEYAGLTLGSYVVYDVDSTHFDDFLDTVVTTSFQIKEVVAESYTDLEDEEAFVIHRYRKDHDTLNWYLQDAWNAKITSTNYQKVEENIRYVKLLFPVRDNDTWNGNVMNNNPEQRYEYTVIDNQETIGGIALNAVLTVLQQDEQDNLINPVLFEEKFAKGVGMVYKRSMDKERDNLSAPWRGYDITMTLNSYGN